ncbi:CATION TRANSPORTING ATPASE [Salix koriyanagi]|uniref:CATION TRANSPORTING ATPASE n=1 Tax=Salix koriyanagi TaxID=2511006 RepID=A0A9Q1AQ22_9ROSI|nr:CATION TRANSPORTING ATPASE [Salix koriyanagi]
MQHVQVTKIGFISSVSSNQIQPAGGEHQFPLEKIARIVRGKDLGLLLEFGGVQAIAVAFSTHLVDGIPGDTEDINCPSIYNTPHDMEPPREKTFWAVLWGSWQTYTCIILSYFGCVILANDPLGSMKTYRSGRKSRKLLKKKRVVNVIGRGIRQQISISENSEAAMLKGYFRNFSAEERIGKVDQITAIGNCLPSNKLLLMQCLKKKGNVVARTGANDLHGIETSRH